MTVTEMIEALERDRTNHTVKDARVVDWDLRHYFNAALDALRILESQLYQKGIL